MSKLKMQKVSDETAREMLHRADEVKPNTYPNGSNGYTVTVLTDKGSIKENTR